MSLPNEVAFRVFLYFQEVMPYSEGSDVCYANVQPFSFSDLDVL